MRVIQNTTASIAAALLLASTLFTGCKAKEETPTAEVSVEAVAVAKQPLTQEVTTDAVLAPLAQAAITPKITAPVHKFYVQRGAKVKAGQLLAVLENRDLTAAELDTKGSYEQAQAAFQTATKASVPEDYKKAEQDVAQTKAAGSAAKHLQRPQSSLRARRHPGARLRHRRCIARSGPGGLRHRIPAPGLAKSSHPRIRDQKRRGTAALRARKISGRAGRCRLLRNPLPDRWRRHRQTALCRRDRRRRTTARHGNGSLVPARQNPPLARPGATDARRRRG